MDRVPHVTVDTGTDKRLRDGEGGCYDAHWIAEDKRRWQGRARIIGGIRSQMGEAMEVVVRLLVPVNEWPGFREGGARTGVFAQGRREGDPIE